MSENQATYDRIQDFEILKFGYNWNGKLFNEYFTSIRMYNKDKYFEGAKFSGILKPGKTAYRFGIIEVIKVHGFKLDDIPTISATLDTGYTKSGTIKVINNMYKHKKIDFSKQQMMLILFKNLSYKDIKANMDYKQIFFKADSLSDK
jgi:hypothetical protein